MVCSSWSPPMHVKILILGGGLTGLSTAYHLEKAGETNYLVLEKESEPGGLCRSIYKNGFTFDYSGHLLHLHTEQGKKLVRRLLGKNLHRLTRRAWIDTQNIRIPFPFQANLYALPADVRRACVDGLLAAKRNKKISPKNFEDFCLQSFGKGIYQAFMRPYNTKLWGRAPRELTCEWCGPFVPLPTLTQIKQSAAQKPKKHFGYNASFYYPRQGGCGALAYALAARVTNLQLNTLVTQIDLTNKTVCAGGKIYSYDKIVNTLPLPVFLRMLKNTPTLRAQADKLTCQPVTVYQIAFTGKIKPFSWIYFPDKKIPFFRVGLQSGFSTANAPENTFSLYVELPGKVRPGAAREKSLCRALTQKGIISKGNEKIVSFWQILPYAYVVYDKHRTSVVRRISEALAKQHCFCGGRYGRWEYSFMESALLQGREIADKLLHKNV